MFAIRFTKMKANADRNIELDLNQKLEEIYLRVDETPENYSLANEARILKLELDEIAMRKTRGAIIRSRARWYELGEKCNKYFFNLEKRSYEKRHISKLKISEGITAEDPKIILDGMKNFYNQLYSSQNQPSVTCSSTFLQHESLLVKLDDEKQSLCEGPITAVESLTALITFQHNKTPGTDGLSAEFYLRFWNDFSCPLIDSFNYSAFVFSLRCFHLSEAENHLLDPKKE